MRYARLSWGESPPPIISDFRDLLDCSYRIANFGLLTSGSLTCWRLEIVVKPRNASFGRVDAPLTMESGDNVRHEIQPYISHAVAYDLILGMDWLCRYNPHINWRSATRSRTRERTLEWTSFPAYCKRADNRAPTARMNNKYSQRTPLGRLENGVTKDEAREECWFQLPATMNAGVLAEAASVRDRSVCSSAKAATA
jgi:hypothetical protein